MDQITADGAASSAQSAAIELQFADQLMKLGGAALAKGRSEDEVLQVWLKLGSVVLGMVRTEADASRAEFDDNEDGSWRAFSVTDFGLSIFGRLTGLEDVRIAVGTSTGATADFPVPFRPTALNPLGSRAGIKGLHMADAWLQSDRELSLRFDAGPKHAASLDAYQCAGNEVLLIAADRPVTGPTIVGMTLFNPFSPVLLIFKGEDGAIDAIDLLPFPSLLRGGLHAPERLIVADRPDDLIETAALSTELVNAWVERFARPTQCLAAIEIDGSVQTGLEPILNPDLLQWISGALGIGISFGSAGSRSDVPQFIADLVARHSAPGQGEGHVLHLPSDCIPTIAALLRSLPADAQAETVSGGMGIVDWNRHGRVWSLWQPPLAAKLDSLQPPTSRTLAPTLSVKGQKEGPQATLNWPLALAYRELPTRVSRSDPFEFPSDMPGPLLRSGDSADTSPVGVVILSANEGASALPVIDSLSRQQGAAIGQIIVCTSADDDDKDLADALKGISKGEHGIVRSASSQGRLAQLLAARDSLAGRRRLIVLDAATVLTDPRTLSTLLRMLEVDGVASAGCLLRAANEKMTPLSAGYSLTGLDLRAVPTTSFSAIDPEVFRTPATYPVVANSMSLLATRAELLPGLNDCGSSPARFESDDLLLGLQFVRQGQANLCTTAVSAYVNVAPTRPVRSSFTVPYRHSTTDLARIVESAVIVQRIA